MGFLARLIKRQHKTSVPETDLESDSKKSPFDDVILPSSVEEARARAVAVLEQSKRFPEWGLMYYGMTDNEIMREIKRAIGDSFNQSSNQFLMQRKVLLLGCGEVGKSTLFKQFQLNFIDGGWSIPNREAYISIIQSNVIFNIQGLCEASKTPNGFPVEAITERKLLEAETSDSLFLLIL